MTDKPNQDEGLGRTWATGSALIDDPDVSQPGKVAQGWLQEKPFVNFMNWIQHFVTKFINHVNEEGIVIWDVQTTYPIDAYVKGSDGELYRSLLVTTGDDPTSSPTEWLVLLFGGPPAIADYAGSNFSYVRTTNAPIELDIIASMSSSTETTIGATGSGATVIWTELDDMPAGAKSILVQINGEMSRNNVAAANMELVFLATNVGTLSQAKRVFEIKQTNIPSEDTRHGSVVESTITLEVGAGRRFLAEWIPTNLDTNILTLSLKGFTV